MASEEAASREEAELLPVLLSSRGTRKKRGCGEGEGEALGELLLLAVQEAVLLPVLLRLLLREVLGVAEQEGAELRPLAEQAEAQGQESGQPERAGQ